MSPALASPALVIPIAGLLLALAAVIVALLTSDRRTRQTPKDHR